MVPDLGLIAFPWCPSLETGRGHDTYSFHLIKYVLGTDLQSRVFPIIPMERLQQGVNRFDYFSKEFLFFFKALFQNCKIYHGISHIGGKTAVLAGRKPLVCTIHDAIPFIHYRDARQAYERLCIKICCLGCDEIIVSSQFTRKFLEKQVGLDPSKVTVIKYGVDHGHFFPKLEDAGQKKRVFSIVRWGNAEQILLAFQKIKRAVPASSFFLGLTSSFEAKCRGKIVSLVKKMGLEDCTKLLYNIPLNELAGLYRDADVYVSPSLGGFSLTLLESMSCGTPVVAFDLLDVPEYVADAGLLVAPNDYNSLVDSVVDVLINEKLRCSLSRRSVDRSEAYSWQRMGFETVEVYRKLLP